MTGPDQRAFLPNGMTRAEDLLHERRQSAMEATLAEGQKFATLELKVAYHKAVSGQGHPVRAEGKVLSRSKQIAFTGARLLNSAGQLLASATSTLVIQST